ncbi:MAG TPA: TRAP transporter large permease subunit [Bacteriovoracaceae bacterium]|nr:TRAP transporter large permease subunit [Bacteriovoracaceae bacterium]
MSLIAYSSIIFLALLGAPIFAVMASLALVAFYFSGIELSAVAVEIFRLASAPTILTIPLFTFAGYVLAESKAPVRLLRLSQAAVGWMPGGVAIVCLFICAFFTAFTGASGVTIIAVGGLLYPMLVKEGYSEKFSLGLVTTCGSLGLLFPPSLPIILYGIIAKVDIDQLFLAGLVPGFILMLILGLYSMYQSRGIARKKHTFSLTELKSSLWESRFELPIPVFVLGGIYGGFVTATEASALSAFYVLIANCFFTRDLSLSKDLPRIIVESLTLVGAILLILCCAMGLTNYLVDEEVPMKILAAMQTFITSKLLFLLVLNVFLLIVGCLMDIFSAIIVVVPLILPIAEQFGVNPLHLAIVFLTNLEIGYITPPVGINLFISSFRFNKPVLELYRASVPFLFLLIIALLIITYIPWLTLFWFNS